jgi:hypothetical protein
VTVNLSTDGKTISDALQKAGYDLTGEPNLIQARLDRGSQVVTLVIDGSGAVRAQITSGGDQNEQRQQAGNMTYTIVQQGQLTINLTTRLQDASDINTLLTDIDRLAAGRPIVSGLAQAVSPHTYPPPPTITAQPSTHSSSSGRVSASDFNQNSGISNSPAPTSHGDTASAGGSGRVSANDFNKEEDNTR